MAILSHVALTGEKRRVTSYVSCTPNDGYLFVFAAMELPIFRKYVVCVSDFEYIGNLSEIHGEKRGIFCCQWCLVGKASVLALHLIVSIK